MSRIDMWICNMQPLLHTRPFASRIFSGDPEPLALERVRVVDMVLQRGAPIRMNRKAAPGDLVTVKMDLQMINDLAVSQSVSRPVSSIGPIVQRKVRRHRRASRGAR